MTMREPERRLGELLDAAGRDAQPTVFGWQTLPARLAATPQQRPGLGRWATLPIGAAVAATLAGVVWLMMFSRQSAHAVEQPIEVRRQSVDLTVLSVAETEGETLYMPILNLIQAFGISPRSGKKLTGQALVKDRRLVLNLKAGDNVVRFTDVAASIDPTSVRFKSLTDPDGTTVVEQSFEYDLATADALLKRFIDREIVCVEKGGPELTGYLASFDDETIVLASAPKDKERTTQIVGRVSLQALRLGEKPADLIVKPTLVWKLRTKKPGQHETLLSYICGFIKWHADYVVEVTPGAAGQPDVLDVKGWVTLENRSGSTYPQAGLRLIAGDVRRLPDPWRKIPRIEELEEKLKLGKELLALDEDSEKQMPNLTPPKVFEEQSLFEYHLYALNVPCTVGDHQIKQLSLLKHKSVQATRRYVHDPLAESRNLHVELVVKNDKENKLGVPLPKGTATLEQRGPDGELAVLGITDVDHTAVKEDWTLMYGYAFDVIGDHREVLVERLNKNARITYEIRLRNHRSSAVAVRAFAVPMADGVLRTASMPHQVDERQRVFFDFTLPANAERTIRYTVVYRRDS
jgi:hypothetical protein